MRSSRPGSGGQGDDAISIISRPKHGSAKNGPANLVPVNREKLRERRRPIAENGFATSSGVNKSAKVVLVLVNVSCNDRLAEQVTGAHSDSVDGSVGVEEPNGVAHIVSPSMVEGDATIDVSFD